MGKMNIGGTDTETTDEAFSLDPALVRRTTDYYPAKGESMSKHQRDTWQKKGCIVFIAAAIITIALLIILVSLGTVKWWSNKSIFGKQKTDGKFCERKRYDEFMVERSNSVSNLGFIILGELVLIAFIYDVCHLYTMNERGHQKSNAVLLFPIWSFFYGISMIFLGLTSFAFHASMTYNMQILDVVFIYVVILCICCIVVVQLAHLIDVKWVMQNVEYYQKSKALSLTNALISLAFVLLVTFLFIHVHPFRAKNSSRDVVSWSGIAIFSFAFIFYLSAFTYLTGVYVKQSFGYFLLTILCIVGGFACREVDMFHCYSEDSIFQFHAIFHILMAIGLCSAYFSARSISLSVKGVNVSGVSGEKLIKQEVAYEKQDTISSDRLTFDDNQKIDEQIMV